MHFVVYNISPLSVYCQPGNEGTKMQVKNRITGGTFTAPPRYWVQTRQADKFQIHGKFWNREEAKQSAARLFADGTYAQVIVQNIDSGRQIASYS